MDDELSIPSFSEQKILVVEDSKIFSFVLRNAVKEQLGIDADFCISYEEARVLLQDGHERYFAALLDLNLPDAPDGQIVDLVVGRGIPSIVFTGEYSEALRESMWGKRIVDYVLKDNEENVQQVMETIKRLHSNLGMKVLVADDSALSRKIIRDLLEVWNFTVLEAKDGREALAVLHEQGPINMLLTDYNMPEMDGVQLVREARKKFSKTRLPVIGLSGMGRAAASAHFLKAGANDYIHKPFLAEELYCRVRHNIETSEYITLIREMAERDFLTGLYNRRAFFSIVNKLFAGAKRGKKSIVVAMMDIDHFKKCNDTFGHDAGDEVIRFVARAIAKRVRESDIVARFGGEEYCVVCVDMEQGSIRKVFEEIRTTIEDSVIAAGEHEIRVTVSIGVCSILKDSLDEMIITSDRMLYQAKEQGRNQVMLEA